MENCRTKLTKRYPTMECGMNSNAAQEWNTVVSPVACQENICPPENFYLTLGQKFENFYLR